VTGIFGISDVRRALVESRSNPAFPAHARRLPRAAVPPSRPGSRT